MAWRSLNFARMADVVGPLRSMVMMAWGCLAALPAAADVAEVDYLPRCGGAFDLCGYVQRGTEDELIPPRFERALEFSEGLAAVQINGAFGFIDLTGAVVIPPRFKLAGSFSQGMAEVLLGDVVGVIDRSGRFLVEPQFKRAVPFTADTLLVLEGTWNNGYIEGYERLDGLSDFFLAGGRPVGLYHVTKGWIAHPIYHVVPFDDPSRGLIWATTGEQYEGPFGLLRADGTWQVTPRYTWVQSLSEGRAIVRGPSPGRTFTHDGRAIDPSGAVDRDGNLVVPLAFGLLSYWSDGYGLAQQDGRSALVLPNGELLGGRYFDEVERPEAGLLPRVRDGDAWFSVEPTGKLIDDQKEGAVISSCPSGLTIRERSGRAEFSHPDLKAPIPLLFDDDGLFSIVGCENPIPVRLDGKWGYVRQDGKLITDPPSFDEASFFRSGKAAVSLNESWGIIDESGTFLVEPTYSELQPVNAEGVYRAVKAGREFWIDEQGHEVPEPQPSPEERALNLACADGLKLFARGDLWGMLGADGEVLIAPEYRALTCFRRGVAWGARVGGTSWCPIGPDGHPRQRPQCQQTQYATCRTESYPEKFSEDPFESSVLWMRAYLDYGRGRRDVPPVWLPSGY